MNHQRVVLIVEDDRAIRRGLVDALSYSGYQTIEAEDGETACALVAESAIDLVLLDVLLPRRNGFEVLEEVRKNHSQLPVIMLTARGSEEDRVRGLRTGADDYVVKPFSAKEVLARIEAVLRRSAERPSDVKHIRFDGIEIDLDRREVTVGDHKRSTLSDRECEILRYLAANHGRAVDRDELLLRVWGLNPRGVETRAVDMQIRRLREKLEHASNSERARSGHPDDNGTPVPTNSRSVIVTVRSKGYMLGSEAEVLMR